MLGGAPKIAGIIVSIGVAAAVATWKTLGMSRAFSDRYGDGYDELRTNLWSDFSSELSDLIARAVRTQGLNGEETDSPQPTADGGTSSDEEMADQTEADSVAAQATNFVQTLDRAELESIEESLRDYDEPKKKKNDARARYSKVWKSFGIGALILGFLAIMLALLTQRGLVLVLEVAVGVAAVVSISHACYQLVNARKSEKQVDYLIDDYRRESP